jgi:hypothetical protein
MSFQHSIDDLMRFGKVGCPPPTNNILTTAPTGTVVGLWENKNVIAGMSGTRGLPNRLQN